MSNKLSKEQWFYDIEVYPNIFSVVFIPMSCKQEDIEEYVQADIRGQPLDELKDKIGVRTFEISERKNDYIKLFTFIEKEVSVLYGFNNFAYDDIILDKLSVNYSKYGNASAKFINKEIYEASYDIINFMGWSYRKNDNRLKKFKHSYFSVDLMKLNYLDKLQISLKKVAVALKWYKIQDLPLPPEEEVDVLLINELIHYNINDVLITRALFYHKLDEYKLRINISDKYGVNVTSASRSKVGDVLMSKFYADMTGLKYWDFKNLRSERRVINFKEIISNKIHFNSNKLNIFLDRLKSIKLIVGRDTFDEKVEYGGTVYQFAQGGLHSVDPPGIYKSTSKKKIIDADVGSFYPNIIVNEKISPEHLNEEVFIYLSNKLTKDRLSAKARGDKVESEALKIVINSFLFGKLGFEYSWTYDLKAMYKTTINGQLYLLMLAEMYADAGIQVLSANTDGITCIVKEEQLDKYYEISKQWSNETGFTLEYSHYKKYVRINVNSYAAYYEDGSIKKKNDMIDEPQLDKGYYAPVIAKCLLAYFGEGKDVDEFLREHEDIYDFCFSQNIGKDFIPEFHYVDKKTSEKRVDILQKTNRYYVSNYGGVFIKRYPPSHDQFPNKTLNVIKGYSCTVFNTAFEVDDFKEYDINYNFYKMKIYEIINRVNRNVEKDIKKFGGTLFDDL